MNGVTVLTTVLLTSSIRGRLADWKLLAFDPSLAGWYSLAGCTRWAEA